LGLADILPRGGAPEHGRSTRELNGLASSIDNLAGLSFPLISISVLIRMTGDRSTVRGDEAISGTF
jgi:hypothetical protein